MSTRNRHNQTPKPLMGVCPSCGHRGKFRFAGEQHWPVRVAKAAGMPTVVRLWLCENCQSSISETELSA